VISLCIEIYLTVHNTHTRHPAPRGIRTHSLSKRAATGTGTFVSSYVVSYLVRGTTQQSREFYITLYCAVTSNFMTYIYSRDMTVASVFFEFDRFIKPEVYQGARKFPPIEPSVSKFKPLYYMKIRLNMSRLQFSWM
jgi:hypothetical protein